MTAPHPAEEEVKWATADEEMKRLAAESRFCRAYAISSGDLARGRDLLRRLRALSPGKQEGGTG